ncbi:hypothetical protein KPP03845_200306 (plasmid) [Streptomyces xanthophaeus]|uniref:hypothetical protein n=1 Tax=Streptomyces xanthophaeus TaxID=67385 RepID=UPI00233F2C05|nr:hypothetical protein [Streptomyces xanthophaeus]WCD91345.1 hypothetical protein KPP03845_200306 [Streptomyces xanthophaeus]
MTDPELPGTTPVPPAPPSRGRRIWNAFTRTPQAARRALASIDYWVQDHTGLAAAITVTLFLSTTIIAMRLWGETILELAKTYQPLFTILWIALSVIIVILKIFRVRKAARLAAATAPRPDTNQPPPQTTGTPTPAETSATPLSAPATTATPGTVPETRPDAHAETDEAADAALAAATNPAPNTTTITATVPAPATETGHDRVH